LSPCLRRTLLSCRHTSGSEGGGFLSIGAEEPNSSELARGIVELIADKKGSDIILLDIRQVSLLADYFVICSGDSERQVRAIVDEVLEKVKKEAGMIPISVEGIPSSGWVLVDYGSVIVHIFVPGLREYYSLEKLWSEATMVVRVQ
jgi:ribosome-associated protein